MSRTRQRHVTVWHGTGEDRYPVRMRIVERDLLKREAREIAASHRAEGRCAKVLNRGPGRTRRIYAVAIAARRLRAARGCDL